MEGWQEGREEGRQEGERSLILRLLTRRLGEIPQPLQAQVSQLPLATLEQLGEALLDFATLDDLARWLPVATKQGDRSFEDR